MFQVLHLNCIAEMKKDEDFHICPWHQVQAQIKNIWVLTLSLVMCAMGPSKMHMKLHLNFLKSSEIFSLFFHLGGVGALMFCKLNWLYSSQGTAAG